MHHMLTFVTGSYGSFLWEMGVKQVVNRVHSIVFQTLLVSLIGGGGGVETTTYLSELFDNVIHEKCLFFEGWSKMSYF